MPKEIDPHLYNIWFVVLLIENHLFFHVFIILARVTLCSHKKNTSGRHLHRPSRETSTEQVSKNLKQIVEGATDKEVFHLNYLRALTIHSLMSDKKRIIVMVEIKSREFTKNCQFLEYAYNLLFPRLERKYFILYYNTITNNTIVLK